MCLVQNFLNSIVAEEKYINAMGKLKGDLVMSVNENEFQTSRANDLYCEIAAAYVQIRALSGKFLSCFGV